MPAADSTLPVSARLQQEVHPGCAPIHLAKLRAPHFARLQREVTFPLSRLIPLSEIYSVTVRVTATRRGCSNPRPKRWMSASPPRFLPPILSPRRLPEDRFPPARITT